MYKREGVNWTALGLGAFLGVSNIGLMGLLAGRSGLPNLDLPVGSYTSYDAVSYTHLTLPTNREV